MIPVTKPFLPPQGEYEAYLQGIWSRQWLTNNGPLVNELELQLKEYLGLKHLLYLTNGTIAIQIAIKALELKGEIITTPFSFVATTSSIVWEGCKPIFVDIDTNTLNIDPAKIEAAITPATCAILATHVYGNPCNIDAIQAIADKHQLKVIYDAAHCFGAKYNGRSVFDYGDVVTTSFHATKLYHTIEGGAVFTKDAALLKKMSRMRNFGFNGPENFEGVGINGKNSEFHAAMGLVNLKYMQDILSRRKLLSESYDQYMKHVRGYKPLLQAKTEYNYAYYPFVFDSEEFMLACFKKLEASNISCRRYFYPALTVLDYVERTEMPVCDSVARRVLCLPLYHTLTVEEVHMIVRIILRLQNN